ncbi:Uncharacterised protein [Achromobacter sp. 2789STDY5608615]|uniref:hypothetical protein n=1 Tax=Achromobacter sp. 2789STDY5608615 TaxID=1806492 RepID=UPI0006C036F1|nr:hypothetical protein [Achromobacter sp. 2789STDY5608615]CUJ82310.1 Uncharacterised protein [Achromobacter sp. 2789STDY5608615]
MFEKRLQTYRDVSKLLSEATQSGWFTVESQEAFRQSQAQAKFLFSDAEIDKFLHEANSRLYVLSPPLEAMLHPGSEAAGSMELDRHAKLMEWRFGDLVGEPKTRDQQERENPWLRSIVWLSEHAAKWDNLTLPYLRLSH